MEHLRKCVGCGEFKPRNEMIKITKEHSSGEIVLNPNSKTFGRSAYLCYNQNCIDLAFKKNKISRILKKDINLKKEEILEKLQGKKGQLDG